MRASKLWWLSLGGAGISCDILLTSLDLGCCNCFAGYWGVAILQAAVPGGLVRKNLTWNLLSISFISYIIKICTLFLGDQCHTMWGFFCQHHRPTQGCWFFGGRDTFFTDQSKSPDTHKIIDQLWIFFEKVFQAIILCFLRPDSGHFVDKIPIMNRKAWYFAVQTHFTPNFVGRDSLFELLMAALTTKDPLLKIDRQGCQHPKHP